MPERKTVNKIILENINKTALFTCLALIKVYKIYLSPLKPRVCRFYPSCSEYTYEAVVRYGPLKGLLMGAKRISCCHPFNPGGYHPVE